jgi:hypothetical protein
MYVIRSQTESMFQMFHVSLERVKHDRAAILGCMSDIVEVQHKTVQVCNLTYGMVRLVAQ